MALFMFNQVWKQIIWLNTFSILCVILFLSWAALGWIWRHTIPLLKIADFNSHLLGNCRAYKRNKNMRSYHLEMDNNLVWYEKQCTLKWHIIGKGCWFAKAVHQSLSESKYTHYSIHFGLSIISMRQIYRNHKCIDTYIVLWLCNSHIVPWTSSDFFFVNAYLAIPCNNNNNTQGLIRYRLLTRITALF